MIEKHIIEELSKYHPLFLVFKQKEAKKNEKKV